MKKHLLPLLFGMFSITMTAQHLEWVRSFDGIGNQTGTAVTTDLSGNVYTAGTFSGTVDFDPGAGTYTLSAGSVNDNFILKTDSNGNFLWAGSIDNSVVSNVYSIKVNAAGEVYLGGEFKGTIDCDPGPGSYTLTSAGSYDAFLIKLNSAGNFLWATSFGASSEDGITSLAFDAAGNVYCQGLYDLTVDFDPGVGTHFLVSNGSIDQFILKLDASGNFLNVSSIGGIGVDVGLGLTIDQSGNLYAIGYFGDYADFDPAPSTSYTMGNGMGTNGFVVKLNAGGNFVWARSFLGSFTIPKSVSVAASGNVYIFGYYQGTVDMDPGPGTYTVTTPQDPGAFISKLDAAGNFVWARTIRSQNLYDQVLGYSFVTDAYENMYVTGHLLGNADFDSGAGTQMLSGNITNGNFYLAEYNKDGAFIWANVYGTQQSYCAQLALDAFHHVYATGSYSGTVNFAFPPSVHDLSAGSNNEAFLMKLSIPVGPATSVQDLPSKNHEVSVYPNPGKGTFHITSTADLELSLVSSLGQLLQTLRLKGNEPYDAHFGGLAPGIYFLTGQSTRGTIHQKIIVAD